MNAIRAKIGKLTNVAAIKASEVLQSVSTRAMAIIEIVESVGSSARGRDYLLVNRGVESRGNRRADHEINRRIDEVVASHSNRSNQLLRECGFESIRCDIGEWTDAKCQALARRNFHGSLT